MCMLVCEVCIYVFFYWPHYPKRRFPVGRHESLASDPAAAAAAPTAACCCCFCCFSHINSSLQCSPWSQCCFCVKGMYRLFCQAECDIRVLFQGGCRHRRAPSHDFDSRSVFARQKADGDVHSPGGPTGWGVPLRQQPTGHQRAGYNALQ